MTALLFVCLGNICRSPMAQGAFEQLAADAGLTGLRVASAGTAAYHVGQPPDRRAQVTALAHGVDIAQQRAARISQADFALYDYILCMDRQNLADVMRIRPVDAKAQTALFLDYAAHTDLTEVPDPYYGGDEGFAHVWTLVMHASRGLIKHLHQSS